MYHFNSLADLIKSVILFRDEAERCSKDKRITCRKTDEAFRNGERAAYEHCREMLADFEYQHTPSQFVPNREMGLILERHTGKFGELYWTAEDKDHLVRSSGRSPEEAIGRLYTEHFPNMLEVNG